MCVDLPLDEKSGEIKDRAVVGRGPAFNKTPKVGRYFTFKTTYTEGVNNGGLKLYRKRYFAQTCLEALELL